MAYYKRSPFLIAYWNEDNRIVLYNYNRHTKVIVSKEVVKIIDIFDEWKSSEEISHLLNIDVKNLNKALEKLTRLKVIHKKPLSKLDYISSVGAPWEPMDLAVHRHRNYGGAYPMSERVVKSPSPIKHIKGLSSMTLPRPPSGKHHQSAALLDVLEKRKSVRKYSNNYLDIVDLSYFLYNSARIKKIFKSPEGRLTKRPYPSGGARYPLEIYVANNKINGIQKGIHYYDPLKHKLVLLNTNKDYQRKFNDFIMDAQSPEQNREPDAVLIITAIFARTMWKYNKIGLSLILSDLGCLYQTMYLVATEMNLAPCPLGGTNEELVRDWLNLNWFEESQIGTFMLGKDESMKPA